MIGSFLLPFCVASVSVVSCISGLAGMPQHMSSSHTNTPNQSPSTADQRVSSLNAFDARRTESQYWFNKSSDLRASAAAVWMSTDDEIASRIKVRSMPKIGQL